MEENCFGRQSSDQIPGGLRLDQCHHAVFLDKKLQSLQPRLKNKHNSPVTSCIVSYPGRMKNRGRGESNNNFSLLQATGTEMCSG